MGSRLCVVSDVIILRTGYSVTLFAIFLGSRGLPGDVTRFRGFVTSQLGLLTVDFGDGKPRLSRCVFTLAKVVGWVFSWTHRCKWTQSSPLLRGQTWWAGRSSWGALTSLHSGGWVWVSTLVRVGRAGKLTWVFVKLGNIDFMRWAESGAGVLMPPVVCWRGLGKGVSLHTLTPTASD